MTIETPEAAYRILIDQEAALMESGNGHYFAQLVRSLDGVGFTVDSYHTLNDRSYTATIGERNATVVYPRIFYVHGLSCDAKFFGPQSEDMARLGISCDAISLPPMPGADPETLFDWQVRAVMQSFKEQTQDGGKGVLNGHSRGAIIATEAALRLIEEGNEELVGVMLQGPAIAEAIRVNSIIKGLGLAAEAGVSSVLHNPRKNISTIARILSVAARRPLSQTITEAEQAMTISIKSDIKELLKHVPVNIEYASNDEFTTDIWHHVKEMLEEVLLSDKAGEYKEFAVISRDDTTHMMDRSPEVRQDIVSLSDPREQSGNQLNFLQMVIDYYRPQFVQQTCDENNNPTYKNGRL